MNKKEILNKAINLTNIISYHAMCVALLFIYIGKNTYTTTTFGIILLCTGAIRGIEIICNHQNKEEKFIDIGTCALALVLGLAILIGKMEIASICLFWGMYGILKGTSDIAKNVSKYKHSKFAVFESILGLGEIVFSVLLCVKLESSLLPHVLYLALSYLAFGIVSTFSYILEKKNDLAR